MITRPVIRSFEVTSDADDGKLRGTGAVAYGYSSAIPVEAVLQLEQISMIKREKKQDYECRYHSAPRQACTRVWYGAIDDQSCKCTSQRDRIPSTK